MAIRPRTAGVAAAFILAMGAPMAPAMADAAAPAGPVYDGSTTFTVYNTQITGTKKSVDFKLSAKDSSAVKFAVSDPADGTVSVDNANATTATGETTAAFTFTPNRTTSFTDTVTVTMTDGDGKTATQSIKLAMAQNSAPTGTDITNQNVTANNDLTVTLNGTDAESGTTGLTYAEVSGKTVNGTLTMDGSNKAVFHPNKDYTGSASFQYTVSDKQGGVSKPITVNITVNKGSSVDAPTMTDPSALTAGGTATLSTTVTPNPDSDSSDALSGKVTFYTVDKSGTDAKIIKSLGEGTRTPNSNTWVLKTGDLPGGDNFVIATYTSDPTYADSKSGSTKIQVTPASASIDVDAPSSLRVGQKFNASATVKPATGAPAATGKVQFAWTGPDNKAVKLGDPVASANGSYNLTDATVSTAGAGTITATLVDDPNLNASVGQASATAAKGTSSVSVTTPGSAVASGGTAHLVATVSPAASVVDNDTVQFFDNGDPIDGADNVKVTGDSVKGVATAGFDYHVTTPGTHSITARFNGGTNLNPSRESDGASFQVAQASSATKLTLTNTQSSAPVVGDETTLAAKVSSGQTPTGKVQFYVGGQALGDPVAVQANNDATDTTAATATATKAYTYAASGTASFTAKYLGDDNATVSTSDAVSAAVKANADTSIAAPVVTTSTVNGTAAPTNAGTELTMTAKVTPPVGELASDKVTFYDGDPSGDHSTAVALGDGTMDPTTGIATLKYTFKSASSTAHKIYAVYAGNANLAKASSPASADLTITPAAATIALAGSSGGVGSATTLTATVDLKGADPKNAQVQFTDAATGNTLGDPVPVKDGKAVYTTPVVTSSGTYNYTATLTGDNIKTPDAAKASVKVGSAKSSQKLASKVESDGTVTLTDTVSGPEGVPTDGTVTFYSDNEQVGTATVMNGVATLKSVKLDAGSHAVTATYRSSGDLSDSLASTSVVVKGVSKVTFKAPDTLTAGKDARFEVMVSGDDKAKPFGGDVTLMEGKTIVAKGVVDANGVGSITTSALKAGKHDLLVSYAGNDTLLAGTSDTLSVDVAEAATTPTNPANPTNPTNPSKPALKVTAPEIAGVAAVGHQLSLAKEATVDHDASLSYKWLRDGSAIPGATGTKYMLTAADAGHRISVQALASQVDFKLASKTSAATAVVAKGTISVKVAPALKGSGTVGYKLIASPGSYSPAGQVSYTWMRDGKVFKTGVSEYRLTKADRKHRFSVKVTVSATGYNALSKTTNTVTGK